MSATDSHSATEYDSDTTESAFEDAVATFGSLNLSTSAQPFQFKGSGLSIQVQYYHVDDLAQPKDERFWYPDGSVVLVTPACSFRAHRSVLSRHSEVFKKLFSQLQRKRPTSQQHLPVIHLEDDDSDIRHVLATMYDRT